MTSKIREILDIQEEHVYGEYCDEQYNDTHDLHQTYEDDCELCQLELEEERIYA